MAVKKLNINFAKWVGGGLGWALGGPIGALLGFAIGSFFDNSTSIVVADEQAPFRSGRPSNSDFMVSLLVLSAAVMKADGKHLKSELDFIKAFLRAQFGPDKTVEYLQLLKGLLEQDIPLRQVCLQIKTNLAHPMRLQLMHYLYGIAAADGKVDISEQRIVHLIADYLNISDQDQQSLMAMFVKDNTSAYKILEIEETASDDELKKAYRKMAAKYHPDKVAMLGETAMKAAQEKFRMVNEAYEDIKKQRGIK